MIKGKCSGVSVGSGSDKEITIEALDAIRAADVIFLPTAPKEDCTAYKIIKKIIPEIDEKEIICETFTMTRDGSKLKNRHNEIFIEVTRILEEGRNIAFLALGDISLYSTYLYMHEKLIENKYESSLIPGITSIQAVASKLNIPIASGDEEVHIFPGNPFEESGFCIPKGTSVFMKSGKKLPELIDSIKCFYEKNKNVMESNSFLAKGVSNCNMDGEIIADGIDNLDSLSGYFTVIIVKNNYDSECKEDYSYFENRKCKYYPCHNSEHINCLFCYCPMYSMKNCPGSPEFKEKDGKTIKICTNCTFPHKKENYNSIMTVLRNGIIS